ncbi:pyridoxal 5'-phosphate synthase [Microlunatus parietis]|uniref:Pyridoxamine 5'-phosphate oxidase n=1 Tax=Microlunatus parietis TaxID=682979 RepID=A0A7Y9I7E5_9ACTN|nr:pyridoxal 5'-phosphate synthase [Microlunatus parietis]NYE71547.1 pyridoxamine 5'-phosphate oxidase [Microlunatus parietis]
METLSGDSALLLPEFDSPPADPLALAAEWLAAAEASGVREPRAATLATATATGRVSARTLLIKDIGPSGVIMGFSEISRKGRELAENPRAVINMYWRERLQQLTIAGTLSPAEEAESDRLFAGRVRGAQAVAATAHQSGVLTDVAELRETVDRLAASSEPIARPATWHAWLLVPDELEFWHGSPDRFHRRLRYSRDGDGFRSERLQP